MPDYGDRCGCAGLNDSLCPALRSVVGCCEGTSEKLWNWDMVITGYLPAKGRYRRLNRGRWDGGSSMWLYWKYQPDVISCEIFRGASYLLVQAMNIFLRQGFFIYPWLSWRWLCRPDWPWTQKSACLCLPSAGITSVHHHAWLGLDLLIILVSWQIVNLSKISGPVAFF